MSSKYHDFLVIYIIMLVLFYKKSKERIGLWSESHASIISIVARFHPLPLLNDIGAGWEWDSIQMSIRCQLLVFQAPTDMLPWCRTEDQSTHNAAQCYIWCSGGGGGTMKDQQESTSSRCQRDSRAPKTPQPPSCTLASSGHVAPNIFLFILFSKSQI